ncbi:TRAP transporter small permease subunit [Allopusillimonas ginsengisoli]|nr:TRAP transporter small permease subunit [Allopusillimonas ginsengisoli]
MMTSSHPANGSDNLIDRVSTAAGALAGWIMVAVSAFIGYEILWRALFAQPSVWVYDISTYSLVWFSFMAAGFVLKEKKHLNVDLLISQCTRRVQAASEMLSLLLMMAFIGFILFYSYGSMMHTYSTGELEPTIIRTPVYLVLAGMVFGLFVFFLQILREIVRVARSWRGLGFAAPSGNIFFRSPTAFVAVVLLGAGCGLYLLMNDWPGLGLFVFLVSLLLAGVPVFTCLGIAGTIGIFFVFGSGGFPQLAQISYKATHSNTLLAIPLYVLAGQILLAGRIGPELFNFAAAWFGHIRGGFAVATVLACGVLRQSQDPVLQRRPRLAFLLFRKCSSVATSRNLPMASLPQVGHWAFSFRLAPQ